MIPVDFVSENGRVQEETSGAGAFSCSLEVGVSWWCRVLHYFYLFSENELRFRFCLHLCFVFAVVDDCNIHLRDS
jgi:hypothetical protein